MSLNQSNCDFNIKTIGKCDVTKFFIDGKNRTMLNWKQISVPELLTIPDVKPDVENLDQIFVTADIKTTKLIETPFSYTQKVSNRVLTADELTSATEALALAVINPALITAISTAVNAILAVPGLNAVPGIGTYITNIQDALAAVTTGAASLTTAITNATAVLVTGVTVSVAISALEAVKLALIALESALEGLLTAINALVSFVAQIPIIGPAVAALVGAVTSAVQVVLDIVFEALNAIIDVINSLLQSSTYFTLNQNAEGTILTGRKLIIEGVLKQKIVYTANVDVQSVHSAHFEIPFVSFIIPYAKFEGLTYDPTINGFYFNPNTEITPDLCEEFSIDTCIEDIFACLINERQVFKNVTLFLYAKPRLMCD